MGKKLFHFLKMILVVHSSQYFTESRHISPPSQIQNLKVIKPFIPWYWLTFNLALEANWLRSWNTWGNSKSAAETYSNQWIFDQYNVVVCKLILPVFWLLEVNTFSHPLKNLLEDFDDIVMTAATGGSAAGISIANYLTGSKLKWAVNFLMKDLNL